MSEDSFEDGLGRGKEERNNPQLIKPATGKGSVNVGKTFHLTNSLWSFSETVHSPQCEIIQPPLCSAAAAEPSRIWTTTCSG